MWELNCTVFVCCFLHPLLNCSSCSSFMRMFNIMFSVYRSDFVLLQSACHFYRSGLALCRRFCQLLIFPHTMCFILPENMHTTMMLFIIPNAMLLFLKLSSVYVCGCEQVLRIMHEISHPASKSLPFIRLVCSMCIICEINLCYLLQGRTSTLPFEILNLLHLHFVGLLGHCQIVPYRYPFGIKLCRLFCSDDHYISSLGSVLQHDLSQATGFIGANTHFWKAECIQLVLHDFLQQRTALLDSDSSHLVPGVASHYPAILITHYFHQHYGPSIATALRTLTLAKDFVEPHLGLCCVTANEPLWMAASFAEMHLTLQWLLKHLVHLVSWNIFSNIFIFWFACRLRNSVVFTSP